MCIRDRLLVILPFEVDFYKPYGIEATFVGHPLLDALEDFEVPSDFRAVHQLDDRPILALLPGSRKQEIERLLPIMVEAATQMPEYQGVVAAAPGRDLQSYQSSLKGTDVKLIQGQTYALLASAHLAAVTSGTATLETALLNVPQVVCYKSSALTYQMAKYLVNVDSISLVNLILEESLVTELIQQDCTPESILAALRQMEVGEQRASVLEGYVRLRERLGDVGASARAARAVLRH